jgi:hypothetical protein
MTEINWKQLEADREAGVIQDALEAYALAAREKLKAAERLAQSVGDQLAYMDMCGDKGDLERNIRRALAAYRAAGEGGE